jgi:uncharacterized protein (DUF433 family)/DNA-binding transcriptional MerR regulator
MSRTGYYTAAEASRISGVPLSTLGYWARTGVLEPSQRRSRARLYSFEDLRDLRVAQALRDQGAKPGEIRKVVDFLRALAGEPLERLAQAELAVVGGNVVYRNRPLGIEPLQPSKGGQRVFAIDMSKIFQSLGQPIAGNVAELHPAPKVLIDPNVRGGTPVIDGTRIPTATIAELLDDDVPVDQILAMYPALDTSDVTAAADWEHDIRRATR